MNREWNYEPAADRDLSLKERATSELREAGLVGGLGHWAWKRLIRLYLKLGQSVTVTGREHVPDETPFVLVSNHSSHLDALVLGTVFPECLYGRVFSLAAGDYFFDSPAKSIMAAQLVNALPVWRAKAAGHALGHLRDRLVAGGCGYIVFPEGTRSRDGSLGAFKPGIGMLVAGTDVPVIPCRLKGAFEAWPPGAKMPRHGSIELTVLPPLQFAGRENRKEAWLEIAAELREAIAQG